MRSCFNKLLTKEPNQLIDRSALTNYISCYKKEEKKWSGPGDLKAFSVVMSHEELTL